MFLSQTQSAYKVLTKKDLIELLIERDHTIAAYEQDIVKLSAQLKEVSRILALRNKKIFGTSSEKSRVVMKEEPADYIAYEELSKTDEHPQKPAAAVERPKGKRVYTLPHPGRYAIPENIRREEHHIYPDEYDPSWNRELPPERTERLSLTIELIAEVTIRHKFARGEQIVMAPFPINDPFYKYKVTVDLVATQMMLRFALHTPYYRFRQLLSGCPIGYSTLINCAARTFVLLAPLRPVLHAVIAGG
jgi:hypothetical protein